MAIILCIKISYIEYILKLSMNITENDFANKMLSEVPQLSNFLQPVAKEPSSSDEFIVLSENDDYHDHILNLLKIKNNPNLNKFYYQSTQKIKKSLLIDIDLSVQDENTKKIEQELVPPDVLKKRMIFNQCHQKTLHSLTISSTASSQ